MLETLLEIFETFILLLKILAAFFSVVCIVAGVYFARKADYWNGKIIKPWVLYRQAPKSESEKLYNASKEWESILQKFNSDEEGFWKLAVIEADKLVDAVIKAHKFQGETMAERMKQISESHLSSIDDLWKVHRLRNHLVHTPEFHINKAQSIKAMQMYQQILKDFKALS